MEQRPLRLGDIVDDYCPRERRITNHAVVAIVEDAIRQTRCSTCDAEHVYKHAREPLRRRKDAASAEETARAQLVAARAAAAAAAATGQPAGASARQASTQDAPDRATNGALEQERPRPAGEVPPAEPADGSPAATEDGWPAHRQLIRATLPRVEGEPPTPRPIPEFTMHQRPQPRGGGFRFGHGRDGNMAGRGSNFAHGRNGARGEGRNGNPAGNANGNGQGPKRQGRRRSHGKRSR